MPENATMQQAINLALRHEMDGDDRVLVFGEDVGVLGGVFRVTDGLRAEFGRRVFDTPLAESAIVGMAVGLALAGWRPVPEIQFDGFAYPAIDQIVNQLARMHHRSRGRAAMPVTLRLPSYGGIRAPEHHGESMEALFAHVPGLKVVSPATPAEAYGLLRTAIAEHFLTPGDRDRLSDRAESYWFYPPAALHPDVLPALRELSERYRIALVANQRSLVVDALRRDGVADYVDHWAISELVGAAKPDPAIFRYALDRAGVPAERAVHIGNRLDSDVRGAQRLGIRTVWVVRGEALRLATEEYVAASVAAGARGGTVLFRHVLPNSVNALLVQVTVAIPQAIIGEALLSFLGLGVQPPTPSLGVMLSAAQTYFAQAPWLVVFPGLTIVVATLGFNLLGDGLRDALDPKGNR